MPVSQHHNAEAVPTSFEERSFTRICWQWRKTALATPRLWAHLQIDLTGRSWNLPSSEVCLTALRFWMTHSGAVPVFINFDYNKASIWMEATQACIDSIKILKELRKHLHRWENISLAIPNFAMGLIFGILDCDLPALKTFEFNSFSLRSALRDRRNMSIRSAPVIQELVLNSQDFVVVPDGIPSGLRVLRLASMKMRFTQSVKHSLHTISLGFLFVSLSVRISASSLRLELPLLPTAPVQERLSCWTN